MANVNKVILLGRVGKDPDVRQFDGGGKIATFSLATSKKYKTRNGEQREETEWHNIVANGQLADLVGNYVRVGDQLYLEGELRTRSWETQNGEKRYMTEIVMLKLEFVSTGRKDDAPAAPAPSPRAARRASAPAPVPQSRPVASPPVQRRAPAPEPAPTREQYQDYPEYYEDQQSGDLPF